MGRAQPWKRKIQALATIWLGTEGGGRGEEGTKATSAVSRWGVQWGPIVGWLQAGGHRWGHRCRTSKFSVCEDWGALALESYKQGQGKGVGLPENTFWGNLQGTLRAEELSSEAGQEWGAGGGHPEERQGLRGPGSPVLSQAGSSEAQRLAGQAEEGSSQLAGVWGWGSLLLEDRYFTIGAPKT